MTNDKLTQQQKAEIQALEAMSDDDIDFSDIPESLDWSDATHNAYKLLQIRRTASKRTARNI